ncbi:MAG: acyl-CoA thioesterase [Clostridia bacterium]|jgi:acyl-CoA hydrolase
MEKHISDSYTEQVQILTQTSLNGNLRLFGGQIMEWIDVVAAVVARRHSGKNVTTAAVDSLEFRGPAYANDTIVLIGKITYVGCTSMEVCIRSYVEALDGDKKLINIAYVIMVALDENEMPCVVPGIILDSPEARCEWEMGKKRYEQRKKRRSENY